MQAIKTTERTRKGDPKRPWAHKQWDMLLPVGTARFPHLLKPHSYSSEVEAKFSVGVLWEDGSAAIEALTAAFKPMIEWAKGTLTPAQRKSVEVVLPMKEDYRTINKGTPEEDKEPTGNSFIEAKMAATTKDGKARKVMVFDTLAKPMQPIPDIGGGSTIRVAVTVVPYFMNGKLGLTVYLNSIQLLELRETGGFNPFEAVEPAEISTSEDTNDTPF